MKVKRTVLVVVILVMQWNVFCQDNGQKDSNISVLFKQEKVGDIGGFGGPVIKFSEINNKLALFTGAKGGVILNHSWILGLEGYILSTNVYQNSENQDLNFVYGGVFGGYIFKWNQTFHFTSSLLLGWGGVGYSNAGTRNTNFDHHKYFIDDHLLVLEPNLELEVNVASHFRIGVGMQYKASLSVDLPKFNEAKLSGFSGAISFKFGNF